MTHDEPSASPTAAEVFLGPTGSETEEFYSYQRRHPGLDKSQYLNWFQGKFHKEIELRRRRSDQPSDLEFMVIKKRSKYRERIGEESSELVSYAEAHPQLTYRELAEWFQKKYGKEIDITAISRAIKRSRQDAERGSSPHADQCPPLAKRARRSIGGDSSIGPLTPQQGSHLPPLIPHQHQSQPPPPLPHHSQQHHPTQGHQQHTHAHLPPPPQIGTPQQTTGLSFVDKSRHYSDSHTPVPTPRHSPRTRTTSISVTTSPSDSSRPNNHLAPPTPHFQQNYHPIRPHEPSSAAPPPRSPDAPPPRPSLWNSISHNPSLFSSVGGAGPRNSVDVGKLSPHQRPSILHHPQPPLPQSQSHPQGPYPQMRHNSLPERPIASQPPLQPHRLSHSHGPLERLNQPHHPPRSHSYPNLPPHPRPPSPQPLPVNPPDPNHLRNRLHTAISNYESATSEIRALESDLSSTLNSAAGYAQQIAAMARERDQLRAQLGEINVWNERLKEGNLELQEKVETEKRALEQITHDQARAAEEREQKLMHQDRLLADAYAKLQAHGIAVDQLPPPAPSVTPHVSNFMSTLFSTAEQREQELRRLVEEAFKASWQDAERCFGNLRRFVDDAARQRGDFWNQWNHIVHPQPMPQPMPQQHQGRQMVQEQEQRMESEVEGHGRKEDPGAEADSEDNAEESRRSSEGENFRVETAEATEEKVADVEPESSGLSRKNSETDTEGRETPGTSVQASPVEEKMEDGMGREGVGRERKGAVGALPGVEEGRMTRSRRGSRV